MKAYRNTRDPSVASWVPAFFFYLLLAGSPMALPSPSLAQETARDTTPQGLERLTIDDYALWRSIGETSLSPDGRWVTYAYSRREVDDSLFIRPLDGGDAHVVIRGSDPAFTGDSRWVAYYVNPKEDEGRSGRGSSAGGSGSRGQGGGDRPSRALVLLDLQSRDSVRWEDVQAFTFSESGSVLAIKKRKSDSDAEHDGTDLIVRYLNPGEEELLSYVDEWGFDEKGERLAYTLDTPDGESNGVHLLDLATRVRTPLDAEREAMYARLTWGDEKDKPSADALAVLKGEEDEELVEVENALLLWPALSRSTAPIVLDPRPLDGDTTSEAASASGVGATGREEAGPGTRDPDALPDGWVLSEKGSLAWAWDADRIFVPTRPQQPAPGTLCEPVEGEEGGESSTEEEGPSGEEAPGGDGPPDKEASETPKIVNLASRYDSLGRPLGPEEVWKGTCPEFVADVDIWHVDDDRLQSVQMIRARRDRNRTFTSVVHVDGSGGQGEARFVQLADESMESLQISDNGRVAMGRNDQPYESDWKPGYADYYQVDLDTGERTPVLEKHLRTLGFSPNGESFLYWKDRNVWAYRTGTGEHLNLTEGFPVSLVNEEFDRLGEKPPHGIAGWTADSAGVILEHRYDLYLQPLDGGDPVSLTGGAGAEGEIRFRILDLDPEDDLIDLSEAVVLSAFGQWTKKAGFFRLDARGAMSGRGSGVPEELVWADARFGRPTRADSADVVLFTRQDFETFPDYHVAGLDFDDPLQVTDANPQQERFNWGRRILFDYETEDGVRLQGTLAIPYDYVEGEKRPMLINYYEKNSQNLHSYPAPRYRSSPNFAGYVSAGYLVMQPDIRFLLGDTHSQMLECINLAVDKVIEMGYVDPERIGVHGHSFSGQGSAYIATHSDRFAAIVAGAAASNLVSDFNQLWKSAGSNQHGYDTYGQGRFATNPYDDFELFVDQSAAQNADRMNTPLLLLHGTDDGSVEWLQAVEFYNGVRWNGGNVILLSYPGEGHGLRQYENQKDFQIRMRQFFDHWLRGEPAPKWMTQGRTFLEKERDQAMIQEGGDENRRGIRRGGGGEMK